MHSKKRVLNKYEKMVMSGLYTITTIFVILIVANLFIPILNPLRCGYGTLFTYIVIAVHSYGLFQAWGFGRQAVPIAQVLLTRILEIGYYSFISKASIIWLSFLIVASLDVLLIILELNDRNNYEYVKEIDNEFTK